jgi:methylated-DNA-[protein]-cysteine S-methyltransferase
MTTDLRDLERALRRGPGDAASLRRGPGDAASLRRGPGEAADDARRAATELSERAAREGTADVSYAVIDSPLGPLLVAATSRGLVKLAYVPDGPDPALDSLALKLSPRLVEAPGSLDEPRRQLEQYFGGDRREFELALDRRLMSRFARRVLSVTAAIPYGSVSTYREVATRAGSPRGFRAAGNALGANPIGIIIPCHRVLHSTGGLGGYGGGLERKRWLLELERGE